MHVRQFVGRRLKWGKKKNGLASDKAEILKVLHTVIRNVVKYGVTLNHHSVDNKKRATQNSPELDKLVENENVLHVHIFT